MFQPCAFCSVSPRIPRRSAFLVTTPTGLPPEVTRIGCWVLIEWFSRSSSERPGSAAGYTPSTMMPRGAWKASTGSMILPTEISSSLEIPATKSAT